MNECLTLTNTSEYYFEIEQDLQKDVYPNFISYGITQIGILLSNEIFYTNFIYEVIAPVRSKVQAFSILPYLDSLDGDQSNSKKYF